MERNICLISDDNYVMPTCVTIQSIVDSISKTDIYIIHILASSLSQSAVSQFKNLQNERVHINIVEVDATYTFNNFHNFEEETICSASIASLFKFLLPNIFFNLDKILYLDGDIIVKYGLDEIYDTDIDDFYGAAVIDSGSIYFKHEFVKKVRNYFNSGVLLLNLKKLRDNNIPQMLCRIKKELNDKLLMDQNVFNLVFDNKIRLLPIKYNFMPVSLNRAKDKWSINDINRIYGTSYKCKRDLFYDAAVIHYSSKDKPWKNLDGAYSHFWIEEYLRTPIQHSLLTVRENNKYRYKISIIIPCYNVEAYIDDTIQSILSQTFSSYEVICLDDGSQDRTLDILNQYEKKYSNIFVYANANHRQGWERNFGIAKAQGEYIYFMDSDDVLESNCLSVIYKYAKENRVDLLLFEGKSFYENSVLENKYPIYKNAYSRKECYPSIYDGKEIYMELREHGDFIVSPCLQLVRHDFLKTNNLKFSHLKVLEDNLYIFHVILNAKRVQVLTDVLYKRRVRNNSTMTNEENIDERIDSLIYIIREMFKFLPIYGKNNPRVSQVIYRHILAFISQIENNLKYGNEQYYDNLDIQLIKVIISQKRKINALHQQLNDKYLSERKLKQDYECMKSGYSFKIGRIITFFPRKIRGGINCYQEHGMQYTISRFFYHLRNVFHR